MLCHPASFGNQPGGDRISREDINMLNRAGFAMVAAATALALMVSGKLALAGRAADLLANSDVTGCSSASRI